MNRPSDYKTNTENKKLKLSELYELLGNKPVKASVYNLTKTTIGLWLVTNEKVSFNKQFRYSHNQIKLGDMVEVHVEKLVKTHKITYPVKFTGLNNSPIPYEHRVKSTKDKNDIIIPIKKFPLGEMEIYILKVTDKYIRIIWENVNYKIRKPYNQLWYNPKEGETITVEIREFDGSNPDAKQKRMVRIDRH